MDFGFAFRTGPGTRGGTGFLRAIRSAGARLGTGTAGFVDAATGFAGTLASVLGGGIGTIGTLRGPSGADRGPLGAVASSLTCPFTRDNGAFDCCRTGAGAG